jgi:CCR4-NOT transcription complex subunit 2
MPPRTVGVAPGGYPGLSAQQQQHRAQNMIPQGAGAGGFIQAQQRAGTYPFATSGMSGLGQPPQAQQQSQQQQGGGQGQSTSTPSLPPHLVPQGQQSVSPGLQSSQQNGESGLDPNDFPALGTAPAVSSTGTPATSYASQATTGSGAQNGAQQRDFTADDFPALGGQSTQQGQQEQHVNGFGDSPHPQTTTQQPSQTPGLLNIGRAQLGAGINDSEKRVSTTQSWETVSLDLAFCHVRII